MIARKYAPFIEKVIRFCHLQLFLTTLSLPILIIWGLPLSFLSPIGNFIFGPVLTAFLLISSILFFTQLLHIPNSFFGMLLEWITHGWHFILRFANTSTLIACERPPLWLLLPLPVCTLLLIHIPFFQPRKRNMFSLFVLLCIPYLYTLLFHASSGILPVACTRSAVTLLKHDGHVFVIDPGAIGQTPSASSWVTYTLTSNLAQKTGSLVVDRFIVMRLGSRIFEALTTLLSKITIKEIMIPYWNGHIPKNSWRAYKKFTKKARELNCRITRIPQEPVTLLETPHALLRIEPTKRTLRHDQATYKAARISGFIDNEHIDIYASQQGKKKTAPACIA